MQEQAGAVTFQGQPLTLLGPRLQAGHEAPDATLVANDLSTVQLADYSGKIRVISTVPSLDTPVCDAETRRFNELAASMGDNVVVLTISKDLPFAQQRWCGAAGVERVVTLSDYREGEFGQRYGLLIKELALLARCVFVLDARGTVRYVQLVKEIAQEPDYDAVLEALKQVHQRS